MLSYLLLRRALPVAIRLLIFFTPQVDAARQPLEIINQARQFNNLPLLSHQTHLQEAASGHVRYMSLNSVVGHDQIPGRPGFTGANCLQRIVSAGYPARFCHENVSFGQSSWRESVEDLFSGIYHRFSFLAFDIDEVGMATSPATSPSQRRETGPYYAYVMGSSALRQMCGGKSSRYGVYGMCRDTRFTVSRAEYENASRFFAKQGPDTVIYPWAGQMDVFPAFVNDEHPNPLPGIDMTGQPVSLQFNPSRFRADQIVVGELRLQDRHGRQVACHPRKDKSTDKENRQFTEYEYAWFPQQPLHWNQAYRASVDFWIGQQKHNKTWTFRTRALPGSCHLELSKQGQRFVVKPNTACTVVLSQQLSVSPIARLSMEYRHGTSGNIKRGTFNTFTCQTSGNATVTVVLRDGQHYLLHLDVR